MSTASTANPTATPNLHSDDLKAFLAGADLGSIRAVKEDVAQAEWKAMSNTDKAVHYAKAALPIVGVGVLGGAIGYGAAKYRNRSTTTINVEEVANGESLHIVNG